MGFPQSEANEWESAVSASTIERQIPRGRHNGKRSHLQRNQEDRSVRDSTANPHRTVIGKFEEIVNLIFAELANLTLKNANLRQTRDLLLPKLISGEIDVSELDIDID